MGKCVSVEWIASARFNRNADNGLPSRHYGCLLPITRGRKLRAGLLNRLGGVVVKAGFPVFLHYKIEPVSGGVLEKVRVDTGTSPEPAVLGRPQPKVGSGSGMGIEPTEFGMIQPTVGVGKEGTKPRGGAPTTVLFG